MPAIETQKKLDVHKDSLSELSPRDWDALPVLQLVCAHLGPPSLRSARLACSQWRSNAGYGLQSFSFDLSQYKDDEGDMWAQKLQRLVQLCPCIAACELVVWSGQDKLQLRLPPLLQTFTMLQQISLCFRQGVAASDLAAMAQLPLLKELSVRSERGCSTSFLPSLAALTGLTQLSLSLYCCERDPVEVSLCTFSSLRQLRHFSITKRHDYNSCYVSMPWSRHEAKTLAQAWPHLEHLELHLNVLDLFMAGLNALSLFSHLTHLSIAALESFSPVLEWVWVGAAWLPTSLKSLALEGVVVDVPAWPGEQVVAGAGTRWNGHGWSSGGSEASCSTAGGSAGDSSSGGSSSNGSSSAKAVISSSAGGSSSSSEGTSLEAPAPPPTPRLVRSPNASIDQLRLLANVTDSAVSSGSGGSTAACASQRLRTHSAPVLMQAANGRLFYMPAEYMPPCNTLHVQHQPLQQRHSQPLQQLDSITQQQTQHAAPCHSHTHAPSRPHNAQRVLPALRTLKLDSCRLEDSQLWRLAAAVGPSLQHLELSHCRGVSNSGLLALPLLSRLVTLDITSVDTYNVAITAGGLCRALEQPALPQLTSLRWTSQDVTFEGRGVQELQDVLAEVQPAPAQIGAD